MRITANVRGDGAKCCVNDSDDAKVGPQKIVDNKLATRNRWDSSKRAAHMTSCRGNMRGSGLDRAVEVGRVDRRLIFMHDRVQQQ
eukprot:SAG11_NODE_6451_length_1310_cov_2.892651_2_plen_85_part_00